MKLEIKIPKGWRRLAVGATLQKGDRFDVWPDKSWEETELQGRQAPAGVIYIRKINRRGK